MLDRLWMKALPTIEICVGTGMWRVFDGQNLLLLAIAIIYPPFFVVSCVTNCSDHFVVLVIVYSAISHPVSPDSSSRASLFSLYNSHSPTKKFDDKSPVFLQRCSAFETGITFSKYIVVLLGSKVVCFLISTCACVPIPFPLPLLLLLYLY